MDAHFLGRDGTGARPGTMLGELWDRLIAHGWQEHHCPRHCGFSLITDTDDVKQIAWAMLAHYEDCLATPVGTSAQRGPRPGT